MKVFFYVQHLLGIGHLKRAATVARALRAEGLEVTLASGGLPVAGIDVLQLPAATSDASFKGLFDEHGRPVDEAWRNRRRDALLAAWRASRADALVVELYPFGRRQMSFELEPLLEEAARREPRPLVVCSVRDLVQRKPGREEQMLAVAERFFDRILVHGDPRVVAFPHAARLGDKLRYTGYVVDLPEVKPSAVGKDEVLVSAGGGAVGRRLLEVAIQARAATSLKGHAWRVLAGINAAADDLAALQRMATDGIVVERSRPDFAQRLATCALSISQAGYNTVMEALGMGARAVVVPFAGGGEAEQGLRARLLAERGLLTVVEESALDTASLAAAVERSLARPRPARPDIDLDGARASARLIRAWLR